MAEAQNNGVALVNHQISHVYISTFLHPMFSKGNVAMPYPAFFPHSDHQQLLHAAKVPESRTFTRGGGRAEKPRYTLLLFGWGHKTFTVVAVLENNGTVKFSDLRYV